MINTSKRILALALIPLMVLASLVTIHPTASASFNQNSLMDDVVFDNVNSMSPSDIDSWLNNNFPNSCISTHNGFSTPDIIGYAPSTGFVYGANVSAGTAVFDAAQAYGLNPQVILTTLEKESSVVSGNASYHCQYMNTAMGFDCPDSGSCPVHPDTESGFSKQIIWGSWFLRHGEQRSEGNVNWMVMKPGWDNSDEADCYSGPMTQGTFKRCRSDANPVYYDGWTTIDGTAVHMDDGATAALYWYTPHFHGNQNFVSIFESWFGSTVGCDYSKGQTAPAANTFGNDGVVSLAGHWTNTSTQGLAYLTPNGTGGFDVGIMDPSASSGLQWRGTWWSQTNGAIGLSNTVFIPVTNSSGLTDLYYATSTNWSKPGFTVGLMANTGHGFAYQGSQWSPASLSLANTKFVPGNWTSASHGSIAYATPNASGGFEVGVMDPSSSGLQWRGTWWSQTNGAITTANTVLIPADSNGDGLSDLYYSTSTNWNAPGFNVGLMANTGSGFAYQGNQWNNTSLSLSAIRFLPGNWTGSSKQGFAYTTPCGSRGFVLGVMDPSPTGLQWRGTWWSAPTLPYPSTALIPADTNGDGYSDLYYATPSGGGFSVSLQANTKTGGFTWSGQQWSPTSIPLTSVLFLP